MNDKVTQDERKIGADEKKIREDVKKFAQDAKKHQEADVRAPAFDLKYVIDGMETIINLLKILNPNLTSLTPAERRRLMSAGVRNYGFLDKSWDLARENPSFLPNEFNIQEMETVRITLEEYRQLGILIDTAKKISDDLQLIQSDRMFRMCLWFYDHLKTSAKAGLVGAKEILDNLRNFFRSRGKRTSTEPTQRQVESDASAILRGKKDGKVVIENISPRMVGGKHNVFDEGFGKRKDYRESEDFGVR